jgi:hypothetical protein
MVCSAWVGHVTHWKNFPQQDTIWPTTEIRTPYNLKHLTTEIRIPYDLKHLTTEIRIPYDLQQKSEITRNILGVQSQERDNKNILGTQSQVRASLVPQGICTLLAEYWASRAQIPRGTKNEGRGNKEHLMCLTTVLSLAFVKQRVVLQIFSGQYLVILWSLTLWPQNH